MEMTNEEKNKWCRDNPIRKMAIEMGSREADKKKERRKELREQESFRDVEAD